MKRWTIKPPKELHTFFPLIGFDPGTTNLGMAYISTESDEILLYEMTFERDTDAVNRIMDMYFLLNDLSLNVNHSIVIIEGASFGKSYRQTELAEIRASFAIWMKLHGASNVKIIAPNTIRKSVFNNGTLAAHDVWNDAEIGRDALAALSCLYYGDKL